MWTEKNFNLPVDKIRSEKKKCVYRLTIMKDVTERKGLDGNKNLHLSDLQKRHYQRSCEATCRHMLEAKQLWFFIPH